MADVRPLPGIRYTAEADLATRVTPPYDVITPAEQERYYARSPENIIRLELGRAEPGDDELDNSYTRAAATFAEWRLHDVLQQDRPALYLYEQRFAAGGGEHRRLTLFARVRLEPWEAGVILPHERTLSKAKDDRLKLTRACAATLSPIMALYDDPAGEMGRLLAARRATEPRTAFADDIGEEHRFWRLEEDALAVQVAAFFAARQLYIADGHHRYETALTYRDEVRDVRRELLPDDAVHFTLMGLIAIEDPGLVVLPTHRIVRGLDTARLARLDDALARYFTVQRLDGIALGDAVDALAEAGNAGQQQAYVLARHERVELVRLTDQGRAAMAQAAGEDVGRSQAWRALDVAALHQLLFAQALGITPEMVRAGEHVSYTRDAEAAFAAVQRESVGGTLAVLLNATPATAIRDVARAGDRMPQKSTYFYPKLITGLVINPLW